MTSTISKEGGIELLLRSKYMKKYIVHNRNHETIGEFASFLEAEDHVLSLNSSLIKAGIDDLSMYYDTMDQPALYSIFSTWN